MNLPFHYILMGTMGVSLLWGFIVFISGIYFHTDGVGSAVSDFIDGVEKAGEPYMHDSEDPKHVMLVPYATEVAESIEWKVGALGALVMVVGVCIVGFSVLGIYAALKKNTVMLFGLVGVITVSVLIEIIVLWLISNPSSAVHSAAKEALAEELDGYKIHEPRDFDKVLNSVMIVGDCCGINGMADFENRNITYMGMNLKLSPACCKVRSGPLPVSLHDDLLMCAKKEGVDDAAYKTEGCYDKVFNSVADDIGSAIVAVAILFIIWQVLQIALAVLVSMMEPEEEEKVVEEQKVDQKVEIKKKFVPFTQVSTVVTSDINRIKSTEIW